MPAEKSQPAYGRLRDTYERVVEDVIVSVGQV